MDCLDFFSEIIGTGTGGGIDVGIDFDEDPIIKPGRIDPTGKLSDAGIPGIFEEIGPTGIPGGMCPGGMLEGKEVPDIFKGMLPLGRFGWNGPITEFGGTDLGLNGIGGGVFGRTDCLTGPVTLAIAAAKLLGGVGTESG